MHDPNSVSLGTFSNGQEARLSTVDRRRHLYLIGKSGSGKSTMLRNLMVSDLHEGRAFVLLDPNGDLATTLAGSVPPWRMGDVTYLDPTDAHHAGINPLNNVAPDQRPVVAAHLVAAFDHIWGTDIQRTPRLTFMLNNSLRLLLDAPGSTMLGLLRCLTEEKYRSRLIAHCQDPVIKRFWTDEFAEYSDRYAAEAIAPIQTRIGTLLADPTLRNMLGQVTSTIDIPRLINHGRKVLIVNLAHGKLGEAPCRLIGSLLITAITQAAQARAAIDEDQRTDVALYCDEFQHFAVDSFVSTLSESRKYRLSLVLAHQFLGQLTPLLRQAIIGNCASVLAYQLGAEDAPLIAAELGIEHAPTLCDTSQHVAWAKLLRNGNPTDVKPLNTYLLDPPSRKRFEAVRNRSHNSCMRPRAAVEAKLRRFLAGRDEA